MLDNEDRFLDRAPAAVYATLLEEGRYLCSIDVRVLHDADSHPHREPPRLTAPNQVWTWDITRLPGPRKWDPLYVVPPSPRRRLDGSHAGNGDTSAAADHQCMPEARIAPGQLTLHQDRGAKMTAKTLSQLLKSTWISCTVGRGLHPYSASRPSNTRRRTRVASAGLTFETSSPGTTARHGGLGLLSTMASSKQRGSTYTPMIRSASPTVDPGHPKSPAKSGSTNRTTPSNATIFLSKYSPRCLILLDTVRLAE